VSAYGLAIQPNGRIVAAGGNLYPMGNDDDFVVVRYENDGSLDTSFGTNGLVSTNFFSDHDIARAAVIQNDGKILIAGSAFGAGNYDFAVARYIGDRPGGITSEY
jgi:uncharacterized delta-60 repeat protein